MWERKKKFIRERCQSVVLAVNSQVKRACSHVDVWLVLILDGLLFVLGDALQPPLALAVELALGLGAVLTLNHR